METHFAEQAEQSDPENEENKVPCPDQRKPENVGYAVEDARQGREPTDDLRIDPFPISGDTGLAGAVEVDAIQRADGDGKNKLGEMEEQKEQVAQREATESHSGERAVGAEDVG